MLHYLASFVPCLKNLFFFHFRKNVSGICVDVTNVNTAKNKTTKYFNFNIQSEEDWCLLFTRKAQTI